MAVITLTKLRELSEQATPGPWHHRDRGVGWAIHTSGSPDACAWTDQDLMASDLLGKGVFEEADAEFIAAAVNYVRERLAGDRGTCWFCKGEFDVGALIAGYDTFEEQRLACLACNERMRPAVPA